MHDLRAKVAYVHGLAEGLDLDGSTREGRILLSIIDVLDDLTEATEDLAEAQFELAEYVEDVDTELMQLEEGIFADDDEDDEDLPLLALDDDDEVCCELIECPDCGETVGLVSSVDDDDWEAEAVECPTCGTEGHI